MTKTFEMNGKAYRTDAQTLKVLRDAVQSFRDDGSKDVSAVSAVMILGMKTGIIVEEDRQEIIKMVSSRQVSNQKRIVLSG